LAGRKGGPKTRNGGLWTEARFRSFIRSQLRAATMRWGPIAECLKDARVGRGEYLCAGCKEIVPATIKVGGRRTKNVHVDHIEPIIDPDVGFVSYDQLIERMFCEKPNLQVLCTACHDVKTDSEKARAKARRDKLKEEDIDDEL
jgi:5-methylcytosine-specific restriction endonuclease McrA